MAVVPINHSEDIEPVRLLGRDEDCSSSNAYVRPGDLRKDRSIGGMKLWHMYRERFGRNNPVGWTDTGIIHRSDRDVQYAICRLAEAAWLPDQHDGERKFQGEPAGGTRKQHDKERDVQGRYFPQHPGNHRCRRRGLLQQRKATHEHRHADIDRGGTAHRRNREAMDKLPTCRAAISYTTSFKSRVYNSNIVAS